MIQIAATNPPAMAPATPGGAFAGHLHLRAEADAQGVTRIVRQSFRAPFHISKSYWNGRALLVQMVNSTAGMLAGDRLDLQISVGAGSRLMVTTPSAARAYMMKRGIASCRQTLTVEPGAWLEFAPEALFPHRGCDFRQATEIHVAAGGELYFADSLAPGRVAHGECFEWRRLSIKLDVRHDGAPLLRERLDGTGDHMKQQALRHNWTTAWHGTVIALSSRLTSDNAALAQLRGLHGDGVSAGVSKLGGQAWILRVIAPTGPALRAAMARARTVLAGPLPSLRSDPRKV